MDARQRDDNGQGRGKDVGEGVGKRYFVLCCQQLVCCSAADVNFRLRQGERGCLALVREYLLVCMCMYMFFDLP